MSRFFGLLSVTSVLSTRISPVVGLSNPAIHRSVADFPQPDGPTRTISSPSLDLRLEVVDGDDVAALVVEYLRQVANLTSSPIVDDVG